MSLTDLASIGETGGITGRSITPSLPMRAADLGPMPGSVAVRECALWVAIAALDALSLTANPDKTPESRRSTSPRSGRSGALRLLGQAGRGVLDSAAPDAADRPHGADVVHRVAVDEHQVGPPARCDDAAVGEAEVLSGQHRRGSQRVDGAQAGVDE